MYGRILSRVFANGVLGLNVANGQNSSTTTNNNTLVNSSEVANSISALRDGKNLKFITAVSGFAKYQPSGLDKTRSGKFGDDAYFIAKYAKGEVLGMWQFSIFNFLI